jgi:hypothetical protein
MGKPYITFRPCNAGGARLRAPRPIGYCSVGRRRSIREPPCVSQVPSCCAGEPGDETTEAVKAFQNDFKLTETGTLAPPDRMRLANLAREKLYSFLNLGARFSTKAAMPSF